MTPSLKGPKLNDLPRDAKGPKRGRPLGPGGEPRVMTALRILPDDLAEIDRRADKLRLTRTDYMIRAALGNLPADQNLAADLEDIRGRLDALERMANLTY